MPRVKAIQQTQYPYNISARCINKEWFQLPMDQVWNIFCEELTSVHVELGMVIHTFVLMSNHFHLLATTPRSNVSKCMQYLMHKTSRRLTKAGNRINQTYAGRHYKCILQHNNFYLNAYKYNYRNPVAANICSRVEEYKYSTLSGALDLSKQTIPVSEDLVIRENPIRVLEWLNTAPDIKKIEALRWGFRRTYFKSKKNTNNGKPIIGENEII